MATQNKDRPQFPRLLICEGPEDCLFFHELIQAHALPQFHIWDTGARTGRGGNTKFAQALRAYQIKNPKTFASLRDILIVADNDESPQDSFQNVCAQIEELFGNGTAPCMPQIRTTSIKPAVTVLMIPWTDVNGHLERLCVESAREADKKVGGDVDAFLAMIGAPNWNNESRFSKAWLRVNLAARCENDPFVPLGYIFDEPKHKKLIPVNHKSFKKLIEFLSTFG